MGPLEQKLLKMARLGGDPIPERIKNKPVINRFAAWYVEVFYELDTERPSAMSGLPPIPWSAIHHYAQAYDIAGELYDDLLYIIRAMDNIFLAAVNKKYRET